MRPTISQLQQWNTDSIGAAAANVGSAAYTLDDCLDTAIRAVQDARYWYGATKRAASLRIGQEQDHAHEVRNILQQIADAAADAGTDLAYARDHVLNNVFLARFLGFTVSDTGAVTLADGETTSDTEQFAATISAGLDTVATTDDTYGRRISTLVEDLAGMVNGQPDVTLPGGERIDADQAVHMLRNLSPDQRRAVLSRMSADDIRHLIQADPDTMGNLDGVPFEHRITANENNIRNALADEIQAGRGDGARAGHLRAMLEQVDDPYPVPGAIDRQSPRQFIVFHNTGNGRTVEMIGRMGPGIRNATVYVPGKGTTMAGTAPIDGTNRKAGFNLAQQTRGPVFVYVDGDLPQTYPEATQTRFAADTAPRLVGFGHELDVELATHAPGTTRTYIGHSYGGSIVGTAEQLGLKADNIIHASSAGTGILDRPHNPDIHHYSMTFPGDIIQETQQLPFNPHGSDPDTAPGYTRLDTGTYVTDGVTYDSGPGAHGGYWDDPGSTAFRNMVKVITGQQPDLYVYREPDTYSEQADDLLDKAGRIFGGPAWQFYAHREDAATAAERLLDALTGTDDARGAVRGPAGGTFGRLTPGG